VAKLRRPTVVAWALNVAARAHPSAVADLLAAGERLRAAQEQALRGDASGLRTATEERRAAVAALAAHAAAVLGDRAPAQAGAVSATLEAATVDEEVAGLLRAGRLDKERSAASAGFGFGDVGDWTPPPPAKPAKPATAAKPAKPATPAKPARPERDEKLRAELDRAVAAAKAAAAELHDAEAAVKRLKHELAEATAAARAARTRANKAELHAEQLRQKAWEEGERARRR
jgi:hypothetical protein